VAHATRLLVFALGKREIVAAKATGRPFRGEEESSFFSLVFISLINVTGCLGGWLSMLF